MYLPCFQQNYFDKTIALFLSPILYCKCRMYRTVVSDTPFFTFIHCFGKFPDLLTFFPYLFSPNIQFPFLLQFVFSGHLSFLSYFLHIFPFPVSSLFPSFFPCHCSCSCASLPCSSCVVLFLCEIIYFIAEFWIPIRIGSLFNGLLDPDQYFEKTTTSIVDYRRTLVNLIDQMASFGTKLRYCCLTNPRYRHINKKIFKISWD